MKTQMTARVMVGALFLCVMGDLVFVFLKIILCLKQNKEECREISHRLPYPSTCTASSIINMSHQRGTFVAIEEVTEHHSHPSSIVYIAYGSLLVV